MATSPRTAVYLEIAPKRTFAGAVDWPGWARAGRDADAALAALLAYGPRYAAAVGPDAGFVAPTDVAQLEIVERLNGGAGTEFGVPGETPAADAAPLADDELARQVRLLEAAWAALDAASRAAEGVTLRIGPRGGGRSLAKMVEHVLQGEQAYVIKLGARFRREPDDDTAAALKRIRAVARAALTARAGGGDPADPSGTRQRWLPRYYVRRSAWHALDHAWELEDRSTGD